MMAAARWLIYALGGGLGHFTRSVALGRAALGRGHAITVVCNTALAEAIPYRRELPGADVIALSSTLDRAQVCARVEEMVHRDGYEALLVDTFPRGLGGELADRLAGVSGCTIWIHRFVCAEYAAWAKLDDVAERYDRILVPGEAAPLAHHPRARVTAPWLVRDADELFGRGQARAALAVAPEADCVLVMGTGRAEEIRAAARLADELGQALPRALERQVVVRFSGLGQMDAHWPLMSLLPGVDLLIGAGGYNTVHEARATETPLLAIAQPRLYDRQQMRLRADERATNRADLIERAITHIRARRGFSSARPAPAYRNGVHQAVAEIETLLAEREHGADGSAQAMSTPVPV